MDRPPEYFTPKPLRKLTGFVSVVPRCSRNRGTRCTDPQSASITRVTGNNIFAYYKYK